MPPLDPALREELQAWMGKARNDLRGIAVDLAAEPPLLEDALFHCQQAAEKSLKAFLTFHNQVFSKTHDLQRLAYQCARLDATLEELTDRLGTLTKYAWMYRYPGESSTPARDEALVAQALAQEVFETILRKLPPDARA